MAARKGLIAEVMSEQSSDGGEGAGHRAILEKKATGRGKSRYTSPGAEACLLVGETLRKLGYLCLKAFLGPHRPLTTGWVTFLCASPAPRERPHHSTSHVHCNVSPPD